MEKMQSHLKLLIGEALISTGYNTSTVVPINTEEKNSGQVDFSIFMLLVFENYQLSIYNTFRIIPPEKVVNNFVGLRVVDTIETNDSAMLFFESGFKIMVDLRDEAYSDPEAMCLAGPDNFWVVWN